MNYRSVPSVVVTAIVIPWLTTVPSVVIAWSPVIIAIPAVVVPWAVLVSPATSSATIIIVVVTGIARVIRAWVVVTLT